MEPPPNDFAEIARESNVRDLCRRFGVGRRTIARWRRECNITGNAPRVSSGDTPEQIAACLSCPFPDCRCSGNGGCPLEKAVS